MHEAGGVSTLFAEPALIPMHTSSFMSSELNPTSLQSLVDVGEDRRGGRRPGQFHDAAPDVRGVFVDQSHGWVTEEELFEDE